MYAPRGYLSEKKYTLEAFVACKKVADEIVG